MHVACLLRSCGGRRCQAEGICLPVPFRHMPSTLLAVLVCSEAEAEARQEAAKRERKEKRKRGVAAFLDDD